jgi:hypothetical protein
MSCRICVLIDSELLRTGIPAKVLLVICVQWAAQ